MCGWLKVGLVLALVPTDQDLDIDLDQAEQYLFCLILRQAKI